MGPDCKVICGERESESECPVWQVWPMLWCGDFAVWHGLGKVLLGDSRPRFAVARREMVLTGGRAAVRAFYGVPGGDVTVQSRRALDGNIVLAAVAGCCRNLRRSLAVKSCRLCTGNCGMRVSVRRCVGSPAAWRRRRYRFALRARRPGEVNCVAASELFRRPVLEPVGKLRLAVDAAPVSWAGGRGLGSYLVDIPAALAGIGWLRQR